jgi:integrase
MLTKTEGFEKKKRKKPGLYGDGRLYKRGRIWWYRFVKNGETVDQSTGKHIQAEAIKERDRIKATLTNDVPALQELVTVGELLDDYFAHLERNHAKALKSIKDVVNANIRSAFGERVAASITSADLENYREQREDEEAQPATINNELSYMRAAYYVGKDRQTPPKVLSIPYFPIVKVNNTRTGFIEVDGYLSILKELPNSLKPLFAAGFHWGCRKSELTKLNWYQVEEEFIALEVGKTKNDEGRDLPIYGDMGEWLTKQKAMRDAEFPDCPWVFYWHKDAWQTAHVIEAEPGSQIQAFYKTWNSAVERAGYPGLLFHDLRRSAVRNMVQKVGISQAEAMRISGHKTPSTFQRYNIVNRDGVKESGEKMAKWLKEAKAKATAK